MTVSDHQATSGEPREPWKLVATFLWSTAALLVWGAVQFSVIFALLLWLDPQAQMPQGQMDALALHALPVSLVTIAALPAQLAVIWLAVRRAGWRFADYLALSWPPMRYLILGFIGIVILLPLTDLSSYLGDQPIVPDTVVMLYVTARDSGTLWLLALALVVAAPLAEELVFRGFMFRGLAASHVGVAGAIFIPAFIWAVMHLQYSSLYILHIFIIGLLFGWLRWRSGSTLVPLVLHGAVNLTALLQVAYLAGRAI